MPTTEASFVEAVRGRVAEVVVGQDAVVVVPGGAAVVPADVPHSARAVTDCRAIVVDLGVRSSVGGVNLFD